MTILKLPIRNDLSAFDFNVAIEGKSYFFSFVYNKRKERWLTTIKDQNKIDILTGVPLLTNVDLFSKYQDERLPKGLFLVFDLEGKQHNPTEFDLNTRNLFLYQEEQ